MKLLYPKNSTSQVKEAIMYAERFANSKNLKFVPCSVLFVGLCLVDCLPKYVLASHNIVDFTIELFMNYEENDYENEISLNSFLDILNLYGSGKIVSTTLAFRELLAFCASTPTNRKKKGAQGENKNSKIYDLFKEKGVDEKILVDDIVKNSVAVSNMVIQSSSSERIIVEQLDFSKLNLPITAFYKNKYTSKQINEILNDTVLIFGGEKIEELYLEEEEVKKYNPKNHNYLALPNIAENITKMAENGEIDPVVGRDKELAKIIAILSKRTKNNPVILGEPGVGKTALVEKLALEIVNGNVPDNLKDKIIYSLSVNSLLAGTRYRGDFEAKMKKMLEELEHSNDVILFIDEIHMIFKAGSGESTDITLGNVLKPHLARGKMRVIGATTYSEYKATIEQDGALDRRFDVVKVNELSDEEVYEVLLEIRETYEKFHGSHISDEMLKEAIRLSRKFIPEKHMPDKVIDLMDEALATAKLSFKAEVTKEILASVISSSRNVDIQTILGEDKKLETLQEKLNENVFGQKEAISKIVCDISLSKMNIIKTSSPASIMLLGESGVGKTYIAKMIATALFDSEDRFIRLDMTEFSESSSVTKIIGAPPGYVGFDKVNGITEKVRINPESVILFDEVDKACTDVRNLLLQILEEGHITDASSRNIDFSHTIIILTANINSYKKKESILGFEKSSNKVLESDIIADMKKRGYSELLDRLDDIILLNTLNEEDIKKIIDKELFDITKGLESNGYYISYDESLIDHIFNTFFSSKENIGARSVKSIVRKEAFKFISSEIVNKEMSLDESFVIKVEDGNITLNEQVAAF